MYLLLQKSLKLKNSCIYLLIICLATNVYSQANQYKQLSVDNRVGITDIFYDTYENEANNQIICSSRLGVYSFKTLEESPKKVIKDNLRITEIGKEYAIVSDANKKKYGIINWKDKKKSKLISITNHELIASKVREKDGLITQAKCIEDTGEDLLLIGTDDGIIILNKDVMEELTADTILGRDPQVVYIKNDPHKSLAINDIIRRSDDDYWVATTEGLYHLVRKEKKLRFKDDNGKNILRIGKEWRFCLEEGIHYKGTSKINFIKLAQHDSTLWVATSNLKSFWCLDFHKMNKKQKKKWLRENKKNKENPISKVKRPYRPRLDFTRDRCQANYLAYEVKFDPHNKILDRAPLYDIVFDSRGNLWVGTDKVVRLDNIIKKVRAGGRDGNKIREHRIYNVDNGLAQTEQMCLAVDKLDDIWVGTGGYGVFKINNQLYHKLDSFKKADCFGGDEGEAFFSVFGGRPPYQYAWWKEGKMPKDTSWIKEYYEFEQEFPNLTSGKYYFVVKDNINNYRKDSVIIEQFDEVKLTSRWKHQSCDFNKLIVEATGGKPPYNYFSKDLFNTTLKAGRVKEKEDIPFGSYLISVIDQNECKDEIQIDVIRGDNCGVEYFDCGAIFPGKITRLEDIKFKVDDATIQNKDYETLNKLVRSMQKYQLLEIELIGHTHYTLEPMRADEISLQRAENVKKYLVSKGIRDNRIVTQGKGIRSLMCESTSKECRNVNMRVEIKILKDCKGQIRVKKN